MSNSNHKDAVVIGAGISGLVCAYRLKALGLDIALVEKSHQVGGVIRSDFIDGHLIERGPNSSQGTEELLALVEELGISDRLAEGDPKAPAYVYFGGKLHAVPSGPAAFIKSGLLNLRGKLRILAELFVPQRRSDDEESIASFARRRIGHQAAERMIAPFVSGIYAGDAEKLSVQAAFPRLADLETGYGGLFRGAVAKAVEARRAKKAAAIVMEKAAPARKRLVSFKRGMGFLPATLAARIGEDLLAGCADCKLRIASRGSFDSGSRIVDRGLGEFSAASLESKTSERESSGFVVEIERGGVAEQISCERVIIASPARAAASLVASLSPELSGLLEQIEYPPLSIVYLSYDESKIDTPLDGFGFLVAPSEGLNILGCVWNSSLFEGRAPEGKALLTTFVGGARNPSAARLGDAELVATAHSELQKVLGISSEPHILAITRWERAIPQYNIGHRDRVRRIESLLKEIPGLSLVGNFLHGVSTGDCVKQADRVAREIHLFRQVADARRS